MPEQRNYEGIVVLGAPRSGTTLVRRLLNAHPQINCPPETNLLSAASRFLEEREFAGSLSVGVVPGLDFGGIDEQTTLQRLREFVFWFFRELRDRSGKSVWAEKTAFDIFHLDGIERLCGDHCRFLCVTRHALDVCCSTKELVDKMEMYLPELHEYIRQHPAPLEAFAHAWVDVNQRLLQFMEASPDRCVRFRYEDLVASPAETLRRVLDFLDLPTDVEAVLDRALGDTESTGLGDWKTYKTTQIESGSIDRWKSLSERTIAGLAAIVNPTMQALGYDAVESRAQVAGDADSKRQQELSRMVARMAMQIGKSETP